jgi:hypothetical protein
MAWNFCGYCGAPVMWVKSTQGRFEARRACASCGSELHRNPAVHVVCLYQRSQTPDIGAIGGPLADQETLQAAGQRLLGQLQRSAHDEQELRLFALVNDFDDERVVIVFRSIARLDAAETAGAPDAWMSGLITELRRAIEGDRFHVYRGVLAGGELRLDRELPDEPVA